MDPENTEIHHILEKSLQEIYRERYQKTEVQDIMQYPMKKNLYLVTYNLSLAGSPPIIRAKIIIDTATEELKPYDPALL